MFNPAPRLLPVVCALLLPFALPASTHTLRPVADTYFETYGSETRNFGAAPVLRMDQWHGRQVFLRFSLADLPRSRFVTRATLRLRILDVGHNEQGEFPDLKTCVALYDVATPWTENGLTYNAPGGTNAWNLGKGLRGPGYSDVGPLVAPDYGIRLRRDLIPLEPQALQPGAWLELDLTDFLRHSPDLQELNLLLRSSTLGRSYTLHSREASAEADRPALEMIFADEVPAFALSQNTRFVTDWARGKPVQLQLSNSTAISSSALTWKLTRKPVSSTLSPIILPSASASSANFVPDVPGRYRVEVECASLPTNSAKPHAWADVDVLAVPPHPRLYVTRETLAQLRGDVAGGTRLSKAFLAWVDAGITGAAKLKFHDMGPHEGCENSAIAWLLTANRKYLEASMTYAKEILRKPMREHFEDVHAATFLGAAWVHALGLHYDYCYSELSAAHRTAIAAWLKEAARWAAARSSAPVAHNDGGARQCLLASVALALLGDDPEAPELHRLSRDNFDQRLLPWLNDGGRGGRSGDGGEYEGLHAFYVVRYAWLSQTATGEDTFSESPFFENRLKHILFGWYPRRLVERHGAWSMRQYYSPSGDHIRMGYVGDTQPYQSAAALAARYQNTGTARHVRWLAGEWPTHWMQYTLRWAVLGRFESIPAEKPAELAYFDPGCNTVFARSDWSDDATWILFENAPFVSAHGSLDSGTFEIFKGDLLAARTGNLDHANVGAAHTMNYLHRTIAANSLLVHDPEEKWRGFLGGAQGGNDGGGQRTNFPLGSSPEADEYLAFRDLFQRGQVTRFHSSPEAVYAFADLTPAYNNAKIHGGNLNRPKVFALTRELLYLRELDTVVVFDRVTSTRPDFKKTFLLHSLGDLEVLDGQETRIDDGEFHYSGATRAVIRHGWPKPVSSFGRCLSVTLLPEQAVLTRIGGRIPLPKEQAEGFGNDRWHGKHLHRHIKDFWVNGTNYPPGNPPETRWFGEPGSDYYVPGTPDESGGRGKWRLEVSPPKPALHDMFLHVLCSRLEKDGTFPQVQRLSGPQTEGALVAENGKRAAVFFNRSSTAGVEMNASIPPGPPALVAIAGLRPGDYRLRPLNPGNPETFFTVGTNDFAVLPARISGPFRIERR